MTFKFSTVAPPPYSAPKPGLSVATVHRCQTCGEVVEVVTDNVMPSGWQLFHNQGILRAFCPRHNTDVMKIDWHKDLYK